MNLELTEDEIRLLSDALDSHKYWQLAQADERDSAYVYLHRGEDRVDDERCPADCDDENHKEIRACDALLSRIEGLKKWSGR